MGIIDRVEREDDGISLPNVYFAPEVEHTFAVILSRIPLWSNIMVDKFKSKRYCASSAESENYFKQLKSDPGTTLLLKYSYTVQINNLEMVPFYSTFQ